MALVIRSGSGLFIHDAEIMIHMLVIIFSLNRVPGLLGVAGHILVSLELLLGVAARLAVRPVARTARPARPIAFSGVVRPTPATPS